MKEEMGEEGREGRKKGRGPERREGSKGTGEEGGVPFKPENLWFKFLDNFKGPGIILYEF